MGIRGSAIPARLWESSLLRLPEKLISAHEEFLIEKTWRQDYAPANSGMIGGMAHDEAKEHVINRFLNSAARMQYVCADPLDEQPEIRAMLLEQMSDGSIELLDLAAGNGSGTLAILSLLCELRCEGLTPKFPVNIGILAVDYSINSLHFYSDLMSRIKPWLQSAGINVALEVIYCDLAIPSELSDILDTFFENSKRRGIKRFLWTISALSGVKSDGMERLRDSLTQAAARFGSKKINSSLLWVEPPPSNQGWLNRMFETVQMTLKQLPHVFSRKKDSFEITGEEYKISNAPLRKFSWFDPYNSKITVSRVMVANFRKE